MLWRFLNYWQGWKEKSKLFLPGMFPINMAIAALWVTNSALTASSVESVSVYHVCAVVAGRTENWLRYNTQPLSFII